MPGAWCEYCPRRAPSLCHALGRNLAAVYEIAGGTRAPRRLEAGELAAELRFLKAAEKRLKARITGAQAEVQGRIRQGEAIPGWGMVRRDGNSEFTVAASVIGILTGVDPFEPELKTPAQMLREGANPDVIASITRRRPSGVNALFSGSSR